jgi:DNA-binding transcriptional ArsR family regulator
MHTIAVADHEVFRALADPTRLRIVVLLLKRELCVCELTAVLELAQPTVSRHMSRLRSAALVVDRKEGRWAYYRLAENPLIQQLRDYLEGLIEQEPYRSDRARLADHLLAESCK